MSVYLIGCSGSWHTSEDITLFMVSHRRCTIYSTHNSILLILCSNASKYNKSLCNFHWAATVAKKNVTTNTAIRPIPRKANRNEINTNSGHCFSVWMTSSSATFQLKIRKIKTDSILTGFSPLLKTVSSHNNIYMYTIRNSNIRVVRNARGIVSGVPNWIAERPFKRIQRNRQNAAEPSYPYSRIHVTTSVRKPINNAKNHNTCAIRGKGGGDV